ncbi:MAG: iron ABC transporter ATP-binding protein [Deltaproteobacteria bacterium]|nr:MAG: iron ABC transporter ATP-binding protein [Deltaproteobacteria bacterium]
MILHVKGVSFNYHAHPVLKGVEFTLDEGELLAILGPNGVGKTSLLKCINAIHQPSGGGVYVYGQNVAKLPPHDIAKNIAYVPQQSEAARLTVFDMVLMGRKPYMRWQVADNDIKIVDAALKRLNLDKLQLRYIDTLSGGELQKVAVARALVQEPKLLLLDEPTSSLDMKNQIDILSMIRTVVDGHKIAAVMTMHDLNTAFRFAHKFIFLKDRMIYAGGEVQEITAEMIEEVYGLPVEIHRHQGIPLVVPLCEHLQ